MYRWMRTLIDRIRLAWRSIAPGERAWKGASFGLAVGCGLGFLALLLLELAVPGPNPLVLLVYGLYLVAAVVAGWLIVLALRILSRFSRSYASALGFALVLMGFLWLRVTPLGNVSLALAVILPFSLLGASVRVLAGRARSELDRRRAWIARLGLVAGAVGLVGGLAWLAWPGSTPGQLPQAQDPGAAGVEPVQAEDPSQPGPYPVGTLTYGSGEDRRPEFGSQAGLITTPVDGSVLLSGWDGWSGWARTWYWGFGEDALPRNGRVWYPDVDGGPFPLVLIVHGNHTMEDFSDPGYAYLGELLASRGYIVVSVDQNFLNGSPIDELGIKDGGLREEIDARGWLLLQHLVLWREWNQDPENPFYRRVDMDAIALIGHSRGGEAVAEAAAFNRLPYYPDDAHLSFDFDFRIRAVVAIAPSDSQYHPGDKPTPLEGANYLALQGANDADIRSFVGSSQFERAELEGEEFLFKSAVYIYGANHGQFNSTWGRRDYSPPRGWFLNTRGLLSAEEQEQAAKVFISAFLEASLRQRWEYLPFFRDWRSGLSWLPDTVYLSDYQTSEDRLVATFEEDLDLTTLTLPGGRSRAVNVSGWREQLVRLKREDKSTTGVYLRWRDPAEAVPVYRLTLPDSGFPAGMPAGFSTSHEESLIFSMADLSGSSQPDADGGTGQPEPLDLTLELVDEAGESARLPLSDYARLQPQMRVQVFKAGWFNSTPLSEPVYQHFEIPLAAFAAANPRFDPTRLAEIHFVFDRTGPGEIILDNVGFRRLPGGVQSAVPE